MSQWKGRWVGESEIGSVCFESPLPPAPPLVPPPVPPPTLAGASQWVGCGREAKSDRVMGPARAV